MILSGANDKERPLFRPEFSVVGPQKVFVKVKFRVNAARAGTKLRNVSWRWQCCIAANWVAEREASVQFPPSFVAIGEFMLSSGALFRSVIYVPGSNKRALDKARGLDCDAIIFDLEDAVAPDEKASARKALGAELSAGGFGYRHRIVRINGLDTEWGVEDARAARQMDCDAVLSPKVEGSSMLDELADVVSEKPIWAMMETPRGVLNTLAIADHPAVEGFVIGTNDLAHELGCATGGDRMAMRMSLQTCLAAARSAGIVCVDGVYNSFRDEDGFLAECEQGREMGMDGKSLIHPSQISPANRVFAPSPEQVSLAQRQIAAFDDAVARGQGVAVLDGKIVENLHVETARSVLAKAEAIAEREAA